MVTPGILHADGVAGETGTVSEVFEAERQRLFGLAYRQRFLPQMQVVSGLPSLRQGLAGRPPVAVRGTPGLFLAGDWVGPEGWLSDGSLASGEQAGRLAAAARGLQLASTSGELAS